MINFKYVDANTLLLDSFRLGKKVYESGFIPTHAISLWRGGTPVGLGVGEYFRMKGHFINHTTVATASYTGVNSQDEVIIKGLEHLIKVIASEDKLLIIDDIYDSGKTITAIIGAIKNSARNNSPKEIMVACIHKKIRKRDIEHETITLHDIEENIWLSYPHEISDLINQNQISDYNIKNKSEEIYNIIESDSFSQEEINTTEKYIYIDSEELLQNSLKLAVNIYNSGYIPDFLLAIWPGGVTAGLPIHEYFKYKIAKDKLNISPPDHISINTSLTHLSYKTNIIGIKYLEDNINYNDKILIINTDFSSGRLVNQTIDRLKELLRRNISIENIKVGSIYYSPKKDATWTTNPSFEKPHFFLKKINCDVIFPQQIHRLTNPSKELEILNPQLKKIIFD